MSARAICAAADVQAPTIYRLFGDKQGLLDAVVTYQFESYLRSKMAMTPTGDVVEDLRRGFDLHVGFGLANPIAYAHMYGSVRPRNDSPAAQKASEILAGLIRRIAQAGLLRLPETLAADLVHSSGRGVCLTLIGTPEDERDEHLMEEAREAAIRAIVVPHGSGSVDKTSARAAAIQLDAGGPAITMRAVLPDAPGLTKTEKALMEEWLNRVIQHTAQLK